MTFATPGIELFPENCVVPNFPRDNNNGILRGWSRVQPASTTVPNNSRSSLLTENVYSTPII